MPNDIRVLQAREFIITSVHGALDLRRSKDELNRLATEGIFSRGINVLLDIREAPGKLTLPEVWSFTEEFARLQTDKGLKTAVLTEAERFDNAEFFAISAKNMGLKAQAFTSFEDAFEWLAL